MAYFLLRQNQNFNRKNRDGITPLMMAALKDHTMIAELLVSVSNINSQDNEGNTALHYAIVRENLNIVKILLNRCEINVDVVNKNNQKATDLAPPYTFTKLKEYFQVFQRNKSIGVRKMEISHEIENN